MAALTYQIGRCLGRGGFGEVYLANRVSPDGLERKVAIKILREDVPNPETAIARLRDEGKMLATLAHPAIAQVVELTRLRGRIALVTEYIDGADVSRFATPGKLLPPRVAAEVMAEVAAALRVASETISPESGNPLRLIHRDIKPENIRISKHGEAKLLDFGIARSHEISREARTTTGNVLFTAGYTAPETFVSLLQHPASDVFAWGATLYRMVTGERFYEGVKLTDQAALSASPAKYSQYLRQRIQRVPLPDLHPLLEATLAYNPDERPDIAEVERRMEALAPSLEGPTLKQWARGQKFVDPLGIEGSPLVGESLRPDTEEVTEAEGRPPPPPSAPKGLVNVAPRLQESTTDRGLQGARPRARSADPGTPWWIRLLSLLVVLLTLVTVVSLALAVVFLLVFLLS